MGKCHVCRLIKFVTFCTTCGHWFCKECKGRWMARGMAAVKEFVGRPKPGCCFGGVNAGPG